MDPALNEGNGSNLLNPFYAVTVCAAPPKYHLAHPGLRTSKPAPPHVTYLLQSTA